MRPLLFITFPQEFRIYKKKLDSQRWKGGANRRLNGTSKWNRQTNRQTDRQTDGHTEGHFDLWKSSAQRAVAMKILK